ncbi:MAG TPA: lysylphosphatidylglycerol synthase domain-containing protein, partial [Bacteroidia bacterium]|nr:lysylphosphatidylglycerol synthase domain-containing protein [Bacteroidia bacterium]
MESSKIKIKSVLQFFLKATIALFSLWFIVHKIIHRENEVSFFDFVNTRLHTEGAYSLLISVIVLMVLNWSIEAIKWKVLINRLTKISFVRSLSAVFAGATVSFFTPNRVGDYAGRMLFLPSSVRIASLLSTFAGNISQLIVTLCCGLAAMALSLQHYVQWNESLVVTTRV